MNRLPSSWPWLLAALPFMAACMEEPTPEPWDGPALRGFNVACWRRGCLAGPAAEQTIRRAREIGATHVAIVSRWYVPDGTRGVPAPDPELSPSLDEVDALARRAASLGLAVVLKPHVNRQDGGSRTHILPANLDAWWSAYESYVLTVAELAQEVGAQAIVVGTELAGLSGHTGRWTALIRAVRERFSGLVTYAANWDELEGVRFLDALDWVGVDGYYPLAAEEAGTVLDLVLGWQTHLARLHRLDDVRAHSLVFTEVGALADDESAQARYYRAALVALRCEGGAWFWNLWEGDHGGTYIIRPPAEEELWNAWR